MSQNPLQQYFRQPKIYINLPSKGVYNKEGTLQGEPFNMPVFGMTGMDEIIIRTPDALMTGESSVKVIESCCPSIKNGWEVSSLDTDIIFAAIRIATYGNTMDVSTNCPQCNELNDYELDLNKIVDHYASCKYNNRIVHKDLVITTRPLNYRQTTEFGIKTYEFQQKIYQAELVEDKDEQQKLITELWGAFAKSQNTLFSLLVESVELPGGVVSERGFIDEWLANCDSDVIDAIKKHINENKETWKMPLFPVKCASCGHESEISSELDYSNFFGLA